MILELLDDCDMGYVGRSIQAFEDQGPDAGFPIVMGTDRFYVTLVLYEMDGFDKRGWTNEWEALLCVAFEFDLDWKHARAAWVWAKRCPEVPSDPWVEDLTH